MKTRFLKFFITFFLIIFSSICFSKENAFYILHSQSPDRKETRKVLSVISDNKEAIPLLITQAYRIDRKGNVKGFIDPEILYFTNKHSIKLMAMITNVMFDKNVVHQFLSDNKAQAKSIDEILSICKQHHLYGVQFDFEMVPLEDKEALTRFYRAAAKTLYQNGYAVSFAIVPTLSDKHFSSEYQKKMYENFSGAYDLKALSSGADFITLMAYDQHIGKITPGPNASIRWVEGAIKYALKYVPPHKISLGVPSYSRFWYTGPMGASKKISLQNDAISHEKVIQLLKKHGVELRWDNLAKVNYAFYEHNWLNEYIFVENVKSLKEKLRLVEKYNLRGISFFRIGMEDPEVWKILRVKK